MSQSKQPDWATLPDAALAVLGKQLFNDADALQEASSASCQHDREERQQQSQQQLRLPPSLAACMRACRAWRRAIIGHMQVHTASVHVSLRELDSLTVALPHPLLPEGSLAAAAQQQQALREAAEVALRAARPPLLPAWLAQLSPRCIRVIVHAPAPLLTEPMQLAAMLRAALQALRLNRLSATRSQHQPHRRRRLHLVFSAQTQTSVFGTCMRRHGPEEPWVSTQTLGSLLLGCGLVPGVFHEVALSGHVALDGGLRDTLVEVEGACRVHVQQGPEWSCQPAYEMASQEAAAASGAYGALRALSVESAWGDPELQCNRASYRLLSSTLLPGLKSLHLRGPHGSPSGCPLRLDEQMLLALPPVEGLSLIGPYVTPAAHSPSNDLGWLVSCLPDALTGSVRSFSYVVNTLPPPCEAYLPLPGQTVIQGISQLALLPALRTLRLDGICWEDRSVADLRQVTDLSLGFGAAAADGDASSAALGFRDLSTYDLSRICGAAGLPHLRTLTLAGPLVFHGGAAASALAPARGLDTLASGAPRLLVGPPGLLPALRELRLAHSLPIVLSPGWTGAPVRVARSPRPLSASHPVVLALESRFLLPLLATAPALCVLDFACVHGQGLLPAGARGRVVLPNCASSGGDAVAAPACKQAPPVGRRGRWEVQVEGSKGDTGCKDGAFSIIFLRAC